MILKNVVSIASLMVGTVFGKVFSYPRPSIYDKSAHFGLKVEGTDMYTVSLVGYDYVQLSMDEGGAAEFRIRTLDKKPITSYSITPKKLPIDAKVEGNELIFFDPSEKDAPSPSGKGVYNVANYGADNTGGSVTKGIQKAMDEAAKTPGSIVYVPTGLYTIGNLKLRSRTSLYLAGGAVLRFTGNPADYTTLFKKSDLFPGTWWIQTDFESTDITVYGHGTIDGNGFNTRENKFMADLLVPVGTTNFKCDGVLVRDSSFWAVTPIQVHEATFTNLKILNRFDVTQDDGVDVVESTKDDSFSAKTWPFNTGTTVSYPYPPRPLKDVFFDDCLAWSDCYGYKIGQGVWEDQDTVTFQNSVVYTAAVGMGIDHKYGTATASHITFRNMDIEGLHGNAHGQASWLTIFVEQVGSGAGPIKDVYVKNIRARAKGSRGGFIKGYDASSMVSGVTLDNILMGTSNTRATSLKEMNVVETAFSEGIEIVK